jgi:hypothetical protein
VSVIKSRDEHKKKLEFPRFQAVDPMSDTAARRREAAVARLKVVVPAFFAIGFLFFSAITVFPLAGMPTPPLDPRGGVRPLLVWLAAACASGGLFALFSGLVVALSASSDDEGEG